MSEEKIYLITKKRPGPEFWDKLKEEHKHEVKKSEVWYAIELALRLYNNLDVLWEVMDILKVEIHKLRMDLRSTKGNMARMSKRYSELKERYTELKAKK